MQQMQQMQQAEELLESVPSLVMEAALLELENEQLREEEEIMRQQLLKEEMQRVCVASTSGIS